MFEHQAVVPAAIIIVGIVWDALMLGVLAILLRDAFPPGPRTSRRPQPPARHHLPARTRSRPAGTAPAARGAAA